MNVFTSVGLNVIHETPMHFHCILNAMTIQTSQVLLSIMHCLHELIFMIYYYLLFLLNRFIFIMLN